MEASSYLSFVAIALAYIASPGPAVFLSLNQGATLGVKRTYFTVLGNTTGLGILAFVSAIGVGALVTSSPEVSLIVRVLGCCMLLHIGTKMFRSRRSNGIKSTHSNIEASQNFERYKEGTLLALTNPKPLIFFASIYPQFIDYTTNSNAQFILLGVTFMLISFSILMVYTSLSKLILGKFMIPKNITLFNTACSAIFVFMATSLFISTIKDYWSSYV